MVTRKKVALLSIPAMVLAAPLLMTSVAHAQTSEMHDTEKDNRFAVRLGIGRLTDSNTADNVGRNAGLLGLSYRLGDGSKKSEGRIDLDYGRAKKSFNFVVAEGTVNERDTGDSLGLSYVQLFHLTDNNRAYAGLGVGVFQVKAKIEQTLNTGTGTFNFSDSRSRTRLGGKALVGYNFSDRFFGELSYTKIGKADGYDPSHFGLSLGVRF